MTILFYSPFNKRSRDTESLMIAFQKEGNSVMSLSQSSGDEIHSVLNEYGIRTFSYIVKHRSVLLNYIRQVLYLVRFCRKHRVDIVYAHLESANFVAVLSQYFIRAKVYVTRHHLDEAVLRNFDKSLTYKLTYRLARKIIVVSESARRFMMDIEKIDGRKIVHINLGYNFGLYSLPDKKIAEAIRSMTGTEVVLLTVCRLTKFKRPLESIATLKVLRNKGVNAALIILGNGEEERSLRERISELELTPFVLMPGSVNNVQDYMGASDFLLHPSILESSCVVVKEAALARLPVIVCGGVGDFDDYIRHKVNGFVVERESFDVLAAQIVMTHVNNKTVLNAIGSRLNSDVTSLFDVANVLGLYRKLNQS